MSCYTKIYLRNETHEIRFRKGGCLIHLSLRDTIIYKFSKYLHMCTSYMNRNEAVFLCIHPKGPKICRTPYQNLKYSLNI